MGQVSRHELATHDHKAAAGFCDQLFGWTTIEEHDMGKASAAKALRRIQPGDRQRLIQGIERPASEPFAGGFLKSEFGGFDASGSVVIESSTRPFTTNVIVVVRIGHRREIYR